MTDKNKRLGGMGLSQFSGIGKSAEPEPEPAPAPEPSPAPSPEKPPAASTPPKKELVTVNIKIISQQREQLDAIARQVRANNDGPVPPAERVFPQHLIGVAIDLLLAAGVDWNQVRNVEELRRQLNLLED